MKSVARARWGAPADEGVAWRIIASGPDLGMRSTVLRVRCGWMRSSHFSWKE